MIESEGAGHLDAWEGGGEAAALHALVAWTAAKEPAAPTPGEPRSPLRGSPRR
jgi:hypothetical protein